MKSSGILLHLSSLPGRYGVGSFAEADKFIDFMKAARQRYWQILPVTPTDDAHSPYASVSAFAGNKLFIDVEQLEDDGLLSQEDLSQFPRIKGNDYAYAQQAKDTLLEKAYRKFEKDFAPQDYVLFTESNKWWLDDYALFRALKKHFGGAGWQDWPEDIRFRTDKAMSSYSELLADLVGLEKFVQYIFYKQWKVFRQKLSDAEIKLIGDVPIYVAYDSADVWANSGQFELDAQRRPSWVAGVPPDYFSEDGQLWGNPLYNWQEMKKDNYSWWLKRIGHCAEMFDVIRIDHFRAFDSYYAIKYGEKTARNGVWRKGVGMSLLGLIRKTYPQLEIIAEDLGDIPQSVYKLRDDCGLPGMKIFQFAFDGNPDNQFLPHRYPELCIGYIGTHDNDTLLGWWESLDKDTQQKVLDYLKPEEGESVNHAMIRRLMQSKANLVIVCMQDIAGQSGKYRMNLPGVTGGWSYMASDDCFSNANAVMMAELTRLTDRTGLATLTSPMCEKE